MLVVLHHSFGNPGWLPFYDDLARDFTGASYRTCPVSAPLTDPIGPATPVTSRC